MYNIFYFYISSDPAVQALQFLDVIGMKDPSQKAQFFRTTLTQVFPFIPRKLWFQHTWPLLEQEVCIRVLLLFEFYIPQNDDAFFLSLCLATEHCLNNH